MQPILVGEIKKLFYFNHLIFYDLLVSGFSVFIENVAPFIV